MLGLAGRHERYAETMIVSGGVPIALSLWRSAAIAPRGTVVFVPGTMMHPLFYADALEALSDRGWNVVGVHPQGHGKSPRVGRTLRWSHLIGNARDAVAATRRHVAGAVLLMGSSQGALVALLAAARGADVDGVLAHNIFDPARPESIEVTRYPARAARMHGLVRAGLAGAAAVLPRAPVPVEAYLDPREVFCSRATQTWFEQDPLALGSYPLRFVADMINADTRGLYDGSLQVPVAVLASRGDPLFPLRGIRTVFAELAAPAKELVVVEVECHLIYQEAVEAAVAATVGALHRLVAGPG